MTTVLASDSGVTLASCGTSTERKCKLSPIRSWAFENTVHGFSLFQSMCETTPCVTAPPPPPPPPLAPADRPNLCKSNRWLLLLCVEGVSRASQNPLASTHASVSPCGPATGFSGTTKCHTGPAALPSASLSATSVSTTTSTPSRVRTVTRDQLVCRVYHPVNANDELESRPSGDDDTTVGLCGCRWVDGGGRVSCSCGGLRHYRWHFGVVGALRTTMTRISTPRTHPHWCHTRTPQPIRTPNHTNTPTHTHLQQPNTYTHTRTPTTHPPTQPLT
jgi:hypothetical protein